MTKPEVTLTPQRRLVPRLVCECTRKVGVKPRNRLAIFKRHSKFSKGNQRQMARGGRRDGAGRPKGSRWKPAVAAFRADAVERCAAIVNADDDPLSVVARMVLDPDLDISIRLSAANTCLPYLFPKLSASTVDSRSTVVNVDAAAVMDRLTERLARLALPEEPVTVDVVPDVVVLANDDGEEAAED